MPSLQVLTRAYDRFLATPARLSAIVAASSKAASVDALIGPTAETADSVTALANQKRFLNQAREKIEGILRGRLLYRQRYRSRQPGTTGHGMHELELPQWPVEGEALEVRSIDEDEYRINGGRYLYRDAGWPSHNWLANLSPYPIAGTEYDSYRVDFWAGYLMPGQIHKWVADRAYIANSSESVDEDAAGDASATWGSWTYPSDPTNPLRFECTTAGTTASTEPTWPTANPWTPATVYATGDWALATNGPIGFWLEATTGGTSGAADSDEPTWPLTAGETATDNTVTWTVRDALTFAEGPDTLVWTAHLTEELPISLQELAAKLALELAKRSIEQKCEEQTCAMDFVRELRMVA